MDYNRVEVHMLTAKSIPLFSEFCSNFTGHNYTHLESPITCNITVQDGNSTKEVETTDCPSKFSDLKGDGICNDALNNIAYNYDDGDCCSELSRFGQPYCVECECKVPNVTVVYDCPITLVLPMEKHKF